MGKIWEVGTELSLGINGLLGASLGSTLGDGGYQDTSSKVPNGLPNRMGFSPCPDCSGAKAQHPLIADRQTKVMP